MYPATEDGHPLTAIEIYLDVVDERADFHLLLVDRVGEGQDLADRHSDRDESLLPFQSRVFAEGLFELNRQKVAVTLARVKKRSSTTRSARPTVAQTASNCRWVFAAMFSRPSPVRKVPDGDEAALLLP